MSSPSTAFDAARFRELARARRLTLGDPLEALATTGSTMDLALAAARQGSPHGATFVTETQTAGRGRHGRSWWTAPGEALAVSILLRPRLPVANVPPLTLVAGLAVRSAVARHLSDRVVLKWPNDVLVAERKLAGILLEARLSGGELECAVVGVGVNVGARELPAGIAETATSLSRLGVNLAREELLADLLEALAERLQTLEGAGFAALRAEFERHDGLRGARVRAGDIEGEASGIDERGALLVRTRERGLLPVTAGEVERVRTV